MPTLSRFISNISQSLRGTLGPSQSEVVKGLDELVLNYQGLGLPERALETSRRSVALHIERIKRDASIATPGAAAEQKAARNAFLTFLLYSPPSRTAPPAKLQRQSKRLSERLKILAP